MSKRDLARLSPVDLREVWKNEARDFTPWLAQEENLTLLGDALGMKLEPESTERAVGRFSADILAKDVNSGGTVLIENQLETTDHAHLGQILTYAAGLGALSVVWIARKFTDEHRAALAWLNDISNENIRFFGLEIEVLRIGDSRHAPKFNLAAKPKDWTKETRTQISLTPTQQAQFDFWTGFREYAAKRAHIKPTKPFPQTQMAMAIGRTGFGLSAIASRWDSEGGPALRAEFVVDGEKAHSRYEQLQKEQHDIEEAFGEPMEWYAPGDTLKRIIRVGRAVDWTEERQREECYRWLVEKLDKLHEVFSPRIKNL